MFKKVAIFSVIAAVSLYATDASTKLDKTTITATGFESPLKDEVRNVTIITADEIEDRGYRDINEVLEKAPGVAFINAGAGQNIDIRGQGSKSNASVKILINGTAMNMIDTTPNPIHTHLIAVEDIERIEIIPGGGAVLYGSGTAGGVINIITKQKPRDFHANLSSKIASYSYKDLNLGIGGKVTEDLYLKTTLKSFNQDGYRYGEWTRGQYVGFGVNYQISQNQSVVINPSYYKYTDYGSTSITKKQLEENRRQAGKTFDESVYKKYDLSVDYAIKFSDKFDFHVMPYYQKIRVLPGDSEFSDDKLGSNFKGRYDYSSGEFIAGYDYLKNDGLRVLDTKAQTPRGAFRNFSKFDLRKQTHSVYFLEKHDFTDSLSLSAGYRFEKALYDIDRYQVSTITSGGVTRTTSSSSIKKDKDMTNHAFEITPNFKYSDTGNIYLKFERGYISPSPVQLIDKPNSTTYALNGLEPETFKTYEIGLKDLFLDQFFSLTAFLTNTKDEIRNTPVGATISDGWHYINIDKTRRYGLEFFAEQNLFKNLRLSETYSYVDAKIKSGLGKGNKVPYVQKQKFVLGVDYSPIKSLNLIADFKYFSSILDKNYDKIDDRLVVDFGTKYKFQNGISIVAGIKNLFNEKYNISQDKRGDRYNPAPERNYYVEFKYAY